MDILAGNLAWIQGPYPANMYTSIKIFKKVLAPFHERGECVEAGVGYVDHTQKHVQSTGEAGYAGEGEGTSRVIVWAAQNWGILAHVFRHHISLHGDIFRA